MKKLLELKAAKKRKNPKFVRDESFKRREVGPSWRKPRGQCSKVRRCKAGHMSMPKPGFRTPLALRGKLASGLEPVIVENIAMIAKLDKKTHTAIISSSLGARKKLAVLSALESAGINIANCDAKKFTDEITKKLGAKKAAKKVAEKQKADETKKKTAKKKASKKESEKDEKKEESAPEDKDKKELDKILTKKQ